MLKIDHKVAQAATELAVFGAILIFLLGTIVRTAVGNGLTQNQNFNAMRMAMLSSWNDSQASSPAHNSPSLLIVEDRLSPDFNKYGDLDRNPYITSAGGSFTFEMLYPLDVNEVTTNLPIMDIWLNGQHFPFTTAAFVSSRPITQSAFQTCGSSSYSPPAAAQQQCLAACQPAQTPQCIQQCQSAAQTQCLANQCLRNQNEWVQVGGINYKLFYSSVPNTPQLGSDFAVHIPPCTCGQLNKVACKDKALCSGTQMINDPAGANSKGDMVFDLLRSENYTAVDAQFPDLAVCPSPAGLPAINMLRCNIAWEWSADLAAIDGSTTDGADPMIGLNPDNNQYPSYDIDGRLKEVTIYAAGGIQGSPALQWVSYEDYQGGDIDSSWDSNSCTLKPGLQNDSEIYTLTQDGTYLRVKEGKLYNSQTGQVVSSVNKRNNINVVQRAIQLSNNTGRFCTTGSSPAVCAAGTTSYGENLNVNGFNETVNVTCANPNPVETCSTNCFTSSTIATTCYDTNTNIIYVRSRIQDLRGRAWATNTAGQLQVQ